MKELMNSLPHPISLEEVNRELQKLNSSAVLTSLIIDEHDISHADRLDLEYIQNYFGEKEFKGYRKLFLRYTTTSSEQDHQENLYLRDRRKLTPKLIAQSFIKQSNQDWYAFWKLELLIRKADDKEKNFVLFASYTTLLLSCSINTIASHASENVATIPLFQYAYPFGFSCAILGLLVGIYLFCYPDPERRKYLYSLFSVTLIWYVGMIIFAIWKS